MRKRALYWATILLPLLLPSAAPVAHSQTAEFPSELRRVLGLREAIELAIGLMDRTGPAIARWKVKEEEGRLWPELSFRGRYSLDQSQIIQSQGGAIAGGGAGEETERYRSELVLSYNLLQFLESVPRTQEARSNERSSVFKQAQEEGETILRVSETYLTFLTRQEALDAFETLRLDQLAFVRKQEAKVAHNLIPSTELLRAQGDLTTVERDILAVRGELAVAEVNLRRLTGPTPEQSISLAFDPRELNLNFIRTEGVGKLLELAKEVNPRLLAAHAAAEGARSGAVAAQALRYPSLVASAGSSVGRDITTSQTTSTKTTDYRYGVGLTLTLPLFDGGVREARITQANLRYESQLRELRRTAEETKALIESEYWTFVEREQNQELLERQVQLAKDELAQVRLRADAGIGPTAESLAALSKLVRLQRDLSRVKAEALFRGIRLALAVGRSPFTPSLPSPALPAETSPSPAPVSSPFATQIALRISSTEAQQSGGKTAEAQPETRKAEPAPASVSPVSSPEEAKTNTIGAPAQSPSQSPAETVQTASIKLAAETAQPSASADAPAEPYEAPSNSDSNGGDALEKPRPAPTAQKSRVLKAIRVSKGTASTLVSILADGKIEHYAAFQLHQPLRFVIDLQNTVEADRHVRKRLPVNTPQLKQIRIGRHPEKIRIVLDLAQNGDAKRRIIQRDDGLQIILGEVP